MSIIKGTDGSYHNERIPHAYECARCPYFVRSNSWLNCTCSATFTRNDLNEYYCNENGKRAFVVEYDEMGEQALVCSHALNYAARYCEDDGRYHTDWVYCDSDYSYYSRDYAVDNLYCCEECGNWYLPRDWNAERDCCNDCARHYYNLIGDWHDNKGYFTPVSNSRYLIGTEHEVECREASAEAVAEAVHIEYPDNFVFEYDCSLDDGVEIIAQPYSLEYFRAFNWEALCDNLTAMGCRSHDTETCGLHIHFARAWFGDTAEERVHTIARVIRFYEYNFDTLLALSRRSGTHYRNYAEENSRVQWYDIEGTPTDREIFDAAVDGSRYVAVNCSNYWRGDDDGTIEFRLGRGTLRAATIRAWVELHAALIGFCRDYDSVDWEAFAETLPAVAKVYVDNRLTKEGDI